MDKLEFNQIVTYDGYTFRITGFRLPNTVYLKPVGITKKVFGSKTIMVKAEEIGGEYQLLNNYQNLSKITKKDLTFIE